MCEKAPDVVREIAAGGSRNHQFLVDLMQQGARLVGTEDPDLLLQEYEVLQAKLRGEMQDAECAREDESRKRRSSRDQFIAGRINATLSSGEVGLLFLNPDHAVEPLLSPDIVVKRLLPARRDGQAEVEPPADQRAPRTNAHCQEE